MSTYSPVLGRHDEELGAFLPGLFHAVARLDPTTSAAKKTLAQFDPFSSTAKYGTIVKGVLITAAAVGAGILTAGIAAGPIAAIGGTGLASAGVTGLTTAGVTSIGSGIMHATGGSNQPPSAIQNSLTAPQYTAEPSVSSSSTSASVGTKQFWDQTLVQADLNQKKNTLTTTIAVGSAGLLLIVLVAALSKKKPV